MKFGLILSLAGFILPSSGKTCVDAIPSPTTPSELKSRVEALQDCLKNGKKGEGIESKLAWSYFQNYDLENAERLFKLLSRDPLFSPRDAVGYSLTLWELGNGEDALRWAVRGATGPWKAMSHFVEGRALESIGRSTEAMTAYGRVLEADPLFAEVRPYRARLRENTGAIDDAWRDYDRILSVDPRNAFAGTAKEKLTARLTKPPSEMVPRRKVLDHRAVIAPPPANSGPILRVGLGTDGRGQSVILASVTLQCAGSFRWVDEEGNVLAKGGAQEPWRVIFSENGVLLEGPDQQKTLKKGFVSFQPDQRDQTIILRDLSIAVGFSWSGFADREVRGTVEIRPGAAGFHVINCLPMESYLYGVVPAEMPARFPLEALKAQAVLARSYAFFQRDVRKPHRSHGYDICDEQHCQVYGGVPLEQARTTAAVDATQGDSLIYKGHPVHGVYSSNCGGHSQTGSEIGWGSVPYWTGTPDRREKDDTAANQNNFYCGPSIYTEGVKSEWVRFSLAEDVAERAQRLKDIGDLKTVKVTARGPSGRVTELTIEGTKNLLVLKKESDIRRLLGMASLRSTLFTLEPLFKSDRVFSFLIHGQGWGHGVGFCQSGGAGRALAGQSFTEILTHYFPEAQIIKTERRKT
ncbi:MAG: SpoIID/LytB domain-containing protein [Elusimicrobia bacterium]|jgi:stage II sporulation protein D|nr:SpoIID/LytB domain-containing protein [Elusimicrobiota bacterium]